MQKKLLTAALLLFIFTQLDGQTLSIHRSQMRLDEFFKIIHKQTGYFLIYATEDLKDINPIDVQFDNTPLDSALRTVLQRTPLEFTIEGKTISVKKRSQTAAATTQQVRGLIFDEEGLPLNASTITVLSGDVTATVSDESGSFVLENVPPNASIRVTHVGYEPQTLALRGRSSLKVILKISVVRLDEVQLIAYGSTTRRLNTGNVSTVKKETLEQQPVGNVLQALEGRVPGVYISQQSGLPGSAINISIRGQNSLHLYGNYPYYIVDGVPYSSSSVLSGATSNITTGGNPLNELNPGDIERIEILKDAGATAIYGSRGANGVILITTRRGKSGKMRLDLNASGGYGQVARKIPLLNTRQYLDMRYQAFLNDGTAPGIYATDLTQWDTAKYTDWQKKLIGGKASYTSLQASVSGGTEQTQYLVSLSHLGQGVVFPGNSKDQKTSLHFSLDAQSRNKKLKLSFSGTYLYDHSRLPTQDLTSYALTTPPDAPDVYDPAGQLTRTGYFDNPYAYLRQPTTTTIDNLIGRMQLSYQLFSSLQLSIHAGYNSIQTTGRNEYPVSSYDPAYGILHGSTTFSNTSQRSWILEPQASFDRQGDHWSLHALIGSTVQENVAEGSATYASGYSSDQLLATIAGAGQLSSGGTTNTVYHYQGTFGRIQAGWDQRWLLTLNGRRDGSSRFGPHRQFGNFASIGGAWIFVKNAAETFAPGLLSFGKIRASYGAVGNDQIADYGFLSTYTPTYYPYAGVTGLYPSNLSNPNYSWELTKKLEIGLDLGFFQDRLLLSAIAYRNRSGNQLVGESLPLITGFSSVQANLAATVQNRGLEFEINSTNIRSSHFSWKTSFNLTIPENKLIAFPGLASSSYASSYEIGRSLSLYKLFHSTGVNPATGIYQFQTGTQGASGPDPSYPDDVISKKDIRQSFYGGLSNTLQWRSLQLDILFQFVKQTGANYRMSFLDMPGLRINQPVYILHNWQQPGDQAATQRYSQDYSGDAYLAYYNMTQSDLGIGDASFIRWKNVSLTWSAPSKWTSKKGIASGAVFFRCDNLLTITHYQGMDPENLVLRFLPPLRTVTLGIQCSF